MLVKELIKILSSADPRAKVRLTNENWDIIYASVKVGIDKDTKNIMIIGQEQDKIIQK